MTKLLKKALDEAAKLDDDEQEALARWLLDELRSERRWEELYANSQDSLSRLADDALSEHRSGNSEPLDAETL